MPDVRESLQQLVQRRQRELGGSDGPISTRQVWLRGGGEEHWSYETVRRIAELGHSKIGDRVADRLSIALNVPVSRIIAAAGQRPRGEPFVLPARANRLSQTERNLVRAFVDAILGAYAEDRPEVPAQRRRRAGAPRFDAEALEGMRLAEPGALEEEPANDDNAR